MDFIGFDQGWNTQFLAAFKKLDGFRGLVFWKHQFNNGARETALPPLPTYQGLAAPGNRARSDLIARC